MEQFLKQNDFVAADGEKIEVMEPGVRKARDARARPAVEK